MCSTCPAWTWRAGLLTQAVLGVPNHQALVHAQPVCSLVRAVGMAQAHDSDAWPRARDCTRLPLSSLFVRTAAPAKRIGCSAASHLDGASVLEKLRSHRRLLLVSGSYSLHLQVSGPGNGSPGVETGASGPSCVDKTLLGNRVSLPSGRRKRWALAPTLSIKLCRRSGAGEPNALSLWCLN